MIANETSVKSAFHLPDAQTGKVNFKWQVFGLRRLPDSRQLWQAQALFIAHVTRFGAIANNQKKLVHFVVVEITTLLYLAFVPCMIFALGEELPVIQKYNWLGARLLSHDNQFILRWLAVLEHISKVWHTGPQLTTPKKKKD